MSSLGRRQTSSEFIRKLLILAVGGGVTFWVTTIATSLLPIAAAYRAAYSNWSVQTVWIASLPMGVVIGGCVSYGLLRFYASIPTQNPILKSALLSFIALLVATLLIDVPQSLRTPGPVDAWYYFVIGVIFNAVRFLLLGIVIGYLYQRLYSQPSVTLASKGDNR